MASTTERTTPQEHCKTAITNVRVFDGQRLLEPSTVVIDGGTIGHNAEGALIVDGHGGTLLPGLIDAHIHVQNEQELRQMASYGVTTGLDMACWPPAKLTSLRSRCGLTDIRSPGVPATSPGSLHSRLLPFPSEEMVSKPSDAIPFVAKRVGEGADYIKIIADVPGPDQATLNAIVTAAHEHNKLVVAHASAYTPFSMAQDANVDIITHAPRDKPLDDTAVARMLTEKRISVPTLTMMKRLMQTPSLGAILHLCLRPAVFLAIIRARRQNPHTSAQKYEHARDSVTALHRAGVPILAGTDANAEAGSPCRVKHGEALHDELELLVEAGLSSIDALRAATMYPAMYFGLLDRGAVEVGKRADLVLVEGNPVKDITATRRVQRVWLRGLEVWKTSSI